MYQEENSFWFMHGMLKQLPCGCFVKLFLCKLHTVDSDSIVCNCIHIVFFQKTLQCVILWRVGTKEEEGVDPSLTLSQPKHAH